MLNRLNRKERDYLARIKAMDCVVCGAHGPSEAHHVRQHRQYLCIPLCPDCHRGALLGWHGQKRAWSVRKLDELDALDMVVAALVEDGA